MGLVDSEHRLARIEDDRSNLGHEEAYAHRPAAERAADSRLVRGRLREVPTQRKDPAMKQRDQPAHEVE